MRLWEARNIDCVLFVFVLSVSTRQRHGPMVLYNSKNAQLCQRTLEGIKEKGDMEKEGKNVIGTKKERQNE